MIPCLSKESLKLLVGTADERYNFSPNYFRKTHFPQVMHRYHGSKLIGEVTELELFEELLEVDSPGNRVYMVFGSTGAGKSELLCWIKDRWKIQQTERPVIRIARSELNPQKLIKKCYETLGVPLNIDINEDRWQLLLKKPITLINQIVWTTLAETLQSDEEIIPIALLLRPVIEKNILEFTKQIERGRIKKPLEIIYREQFEDLFANTTLSAPIEYKSLRQSLSHKLDKFLFEGWDIASLFKQLTVVSKNLSLRPLLLIDDLVQSVNIYATEILDQLITLEEGNWDVVIGLTPGAFQDSAKGVELTQRIQNLDTIDDRVKKLWLSDEMGKTFYNLDRSQVVSYMTNYLKELKSAQGFTCSISCQHYQNCKGLLPLDQGQMVSMEHSGYVQLLPFNENMVKRMYDAVPTGKGKLRYMILNAKELIRFFQKGDRQHLSRVMPLILREKFAEHPDLFIKTLAEWYSHEKMENAFLPRQLLKHFGYQLEDTSVPLHTLGIKSNVAVEQTIVETPVDQWEEQYIVRDWVEGKNINIELLESVRLGLTCLVHDVVKATNISRPFTPRAISMIQRKEVNNRSRYPIIFSEEKVNWKKVIRIRRGYPAIEVSNMHLLKPTERGKKFQRIAGDLDTALWVYQAEMLRYQWQERLEDILGLKLPIFASQLKKWVTQWSIVGKSNYTSTVSSPFTKEILELAEQLYQDWYLLRDNMVDPILSTFETENRNFEQWLNSFVPDKSLEHYQIGYISLYTFIVKLKEDFIVYKEELSFELSRDLEKKILLLPYLRSIQEPPHRTCAEILNQFQRKSSFEFNDFVLYAELEMVLEEHQISKEFQDVQQHRDKLGRLITKYTELKRQFIFLAREMGDEIQDSSVDIRLPWGNLSETEEKYVNLNNALTRLNQCMFFTPRNVVRYIFSTGYTSQSLNYIRELWANILESGQCLLRGELARSEMNHYLSGWESIDFYRVKNEILDLERKDNDATNLFYRLKSDLRWEESNDLTEVLHLIQAEKKIRPAIRKQLIQLFETGYSTLPPVQGRKILDELKERLPSVFEALQVKLVVGNRFLEK